MPVPPGVVTETSTAPAEFAGVVAVIEVALTTVTPVAAVPPNVTAVAPVKLVPVMVTLVTPAVGPEFGLTLVTVGDTAIACVTVANGSPHTIAMHKMARLITCQAGQ